jgi:fermentation-respiration switch protein FrsA (DUF1100 family)
MRCWPTALGNTHCLRHFWHALRAVLIAYLAVVLIAMFLENSLIFFPSRYPEGNWNPVGLDFEDASFASADGTPLCGWYVPRQDARAAVLFCHGNAGNITHRTGILKMLNQRAGVSVLIFDYRGYGRSKGRPNEAGILADARAARHWLAVREKIADRDVVLMGESLGGAVAVDLAARDGARALILESTFTSAPDMAAHFYPWLPVRWAMQTRLDSLSKIGDYHGPLLLAHGTADTIVPIEFGRRLFAAANEPKKLIVLPGHDHNDGMPAQYYDDLAKFLDGIGGR